MCMASPQTENGYTRIANELLDVVVTLPLFDRKIRVWLFVLRKTYGYGKKEDYISLSQFMEGTKIDRSSICKTIKSLVANKTLLKRGSFYQINKNYDGWLVADTPLVGSGKYDNQVVAKLPHTKETIQKKKTPKGKMKKNSFGKYNEDQPSDSFDSVVDLDTGEHRVEARKQSLNVSYRKMLEWAEERRGFKFLPQTITKQFKAFAIAVRNKINPDALKARWVEFEKDNFRKEKGWDWMDVVLSFSKKQ